MEGFPKRRETKLDFVKTYKDMWPLEKRESKSRSHGMDKDFPYNYSIQTLSTTGKQLKELRNRLAKVTNRKQQENFFNFL